MPGQATESGGRTQVRSHWIKTVLGHDMEGHSAAGKHHSHHGSHHQAKPPPAATPQEASQHRQYEEDFNAHFATGGPALDAALAKTQRLVGLDAKVREAEHAAISARDAAMAAASAADTGKQWAKALGQADDFTAAMKKLPKAYANGVAALNAQIAHALDETRKQAEGLKQLNGGAAHAIPAAMDALAKSQAQANQGATPEDILVALVPVRDRAVQALRDAAAPQKIKANNVVSEAIGNLRHQAAEAIGAAPMSDDRRALQARLLDLDHRKAEADKEQNVDARAQDLGELSKLAQQLLADGKTLLG